VAKTSTGHSLKKTLLTLSSRRFRGVFGKSFYLLIIIILGLVPLLWFREGLFIARGDYFPYREINPLNSLNNDLYLWSPQNIGNSNRMDYSLSYEIILLFFRSLGLTAGSAQIIIQIFFFLGAGLSMYYLSKTVYPKHELAPLISGIFYMFNFFVLQTRLIIAMAWTYTFLPLLIALLIKIIETTYQHGSKAANKSIISFAIISAISVSFASSNPGYVIIIIVNLLMVLLYYMIVQKQIRPILGNITKLTLISIPLNLWWIISIFNYLWSPSVFNPQINATAWAWTEARASFLNLFLLNGRWSWRPEYIPYINAYSNPILIVLTFIPFLLAATALLFKSRKSYFNAYLMLIILAFIFLAKGLHEPFSQLNLLLYTYIPSMTVFRESVTKFTMALMPFLALLIGYAVDHFANLKISRIKPNRVTKTVIVTFFTCTFIVAAFPLVTNPIEAKTQQLPFSSYVQIPNYWNQATDWLNNQTGEFKILVTPPDDFYQMPYNWGYYGTDNFLEQLIQKPIISTYYTYSYKTNPDSTLNLQELQSTIKYNRTAEFKAFLDLLNVKYILQRNDVYYNFTGRNIISPDEMQTFLTQQPYIHLAQKFGQLYIYEYTEPKPYMYTLNQTTLQQTSVKIENTTTFERTWDFNSLADLEEWQNTTLEIQWQALQQLSLDNGALKMELWNSTWGWKTINSPIILAQYGNIYQIQLDVKGQNAHKVHVKIAEYDQNKKIITANYISSINDGTFDWTHKTFNFELTNETTKYIQIQVWHGHETDKPFPNTIWIDNVQIKGYTTTLNTTGLNLIFPNTTQNQPATILNYQKINPTKITATVDATQPFTLAISEALDSSWTAYVNGEQYKPTPLYLGLQGFQINQTGTLNIDIEYEPQTWFFYGSIISATTLTVCAVYLTYSFTKNKNLPSRIKQKLTRLKPQ
jgi:hypothetical protein